jgi:hypothetical protein
MKTTNQRMIAIIEREVDQEMAFGRKKTSIIEDLLLLNVEHQLIRKMKLRLRISSQNAQEMLSKSSLI